MLKEVRARYEKGRLVIAEGSEPPDGAEVIVVYQTPAAAEGSAKDSDDELYGSWAGKFPADFDIDEALREIRSGWKPRRLDNVVDPTRRRLGDARG